MAQKFKDTQDFCVQMTQTITTNFVGQLNNLSDECPNEWRTNFFPIFLSSLTSIFYTICNQHNWDIDDLVDEVFKGMKMTFTEMKKKDNNIQVQKINLDTRNENVH
jgi:hypothetical protein